MQHAVPAANPRVLPCAQEAYLSLANKTLMFLSEAARQYDAQYIVKVDDDVYLRLDRIPHAISQWRDIHAGVCGHHKGCLKRQCVDSLLGMAVCRPCSKQWQGCRLL